MFEQSVIQQQHTKPWTFGVSMTLQAAIIGSAILLSILQTQKMDIASIKNPLMAPPLRRVMESVQIVGVIHEGGIGIPRATVRPFVVPRTIPHGIATIVDEPGSAPEITGRMTGSPDGVYYGAVLDPSLATQQIAIPKPPPVPPARPAAQEKTAPLRVSSGVMEARIIRRVVPVYPPLAKAARVQGKVHLLGVIGKNGTIQDLRVIDGHPLLLQATLDAVRQWIYRPTLLSGEPVDVITPIEVTFTLAQ